MRICVVHLISLIIVLIPIMLNVYFLLKNYRENHNIHGSMNEGQYKENSYVKSRVRQRVLEHTHDLDSVSQSLSEISDILSEHTFLPTCSENVISSSRYFRSVDKSDNQSNGCNTSHYINYADETLGAHIQNVKGESLLRSSLSQIVGLEHSSNPPANLLRSSIDPGSCFAFKDKELELEIKLAREVWVELIEMEHISKNRSPTKETSAAPKNFTVYGVDTLTGQDVHLGDFEFANIKTCQLFKIPVKRRFQILKVRFQSNHGHPDYTCVYRIAVYGQP